MNMSASDVVTDEVTVSFTRLLPGTKTTKTRVYVSNAADPDFPHPPYGQKGDNPEHDAGWRRYNREELRLMRETAERGLRAAGLGHLTLKFSKHAGCSMCPCSPGFIVQGEASLVVRSGIGFVEAIWVTRESEAKLYQLDAIARRAKELYALTGNSVYRLLDLRPENVSYRQAVELQHELYRRRREALAAQDADA